MKDAESAFGFKRAFQVFPKEGAVACEILYTYCLGGGVRQDVED